MVDWLEHPDLQRLGDPEDLWQVVQHLTARLDANPQDARAYFLRGNAYLDQRCFDLARDDYTRAARTDPGRPDRLQQPGHRVSQPGQPGAGNRGLS